MRPSNFLAIPGRTARRVAIKKKSEPFVATPQDTQPARLILLRNYHNWARGCLLTHASAYYNSIVALSALKCRYCQFLVLVSPKALSWTATDHDLDLIAAFEDRAPDKILDVKIART